MRAAKREGLPVSCDVSANHLHLTDVDIGFFDARYRLQPPLRQRDRDAIRAALADGTVDALCSDHTAVTAAGKAAPFAQAQPGAPGLATLLPLTLKWARDQRVPLAEALARVTSGPGRVARRGAASAVRRGPGWPLARPPIFVWSTWTRNRRRIPQRCLAAAPSARSRV